MFQCNYKAFMVGYHSIGDSIKIYVQEDFISHTIAHVKMPDPENVTESQLDPGKIP